MSPNTEAMETLAFPVRGLIGARGVGGVTRVAGGGGEAGRGVTIARRIEMLDERSFSGVPGLGRIFLEGSSVRGETGGVCEVGVRGRGGVAATFELVGRKELEATRVTRGGLAGIRETGEAGRWTGGDDTFDDACMWEVLVA
jgi:hypothetical protein